MLNASEKLTALVQVATPLVNHPKIGRPASFFPMNFCSRRNAKFSTIDLVTLHPFRGGSAPKRNTVLHDAGSAVP